MNKDINTDEYEMIGKINRIICVGKHQIAVNSRVFVSEEKIGRHNKILY